MEFFVAVKQRDDHAGVEKNWLHLPNPSRCFLFDPRSDKPEANWPIPITAFFFLRRRLVSRARIPSRTTSEGVRPNSRTNVFSRFRDALSSLAWITKLMKHIVLQIV